MRHSIGSKEETHAIEDGIEIRLHINYSKLKELIEQNPNIISKICNDEGENYDKILIKLKRIAKNSSKFEPYLIDWRPIKK